MRTCQLVVREGLSIKTTAESIGESVAQHTVKSIRGMSTGEIAICRSLFKDTINYKEVKIVAAIHRSQEAKPWPGVITDDHKLVIYFPPKTGSMPAGYVHHFLDDFSQPEGGKDEKRLAILLFIHEMTHIWQHCLGKYKRGSKVLKSKNDIDSAGYHIPWETENPKHFSLYNNEQQAEIVASYYDSIHYIDRNHPTKRISYILHAMQAFLKNPFDKKLLPSNALDRR